MTGEDWARGEGAAAFPHQRRRKRDGVNCRCAITLFTNGTVGVTPESGPATRTVCERLVESETLSGPYSRHETGPIPHLTTSKRRRHRVQVEGSGGIFLRDLSPAAAPGGCWTHEQNPGVSSMSEHQSATPRPLQGLYLFAPSTHGTLRRFRDPEDPPWGYRPQWDLLGVGTLSSVCRAGGLNGKTHNNLVRVARLEGINKGSGRTGV